MAGQWGRHGKGWAGVMLGQGRRKGMGKAVFQGMLLRAGVSSPSHKAGVREQGGQGRCWEARAQAAGHVSLMGGGGTHKVRKRGMLGRQAGRAGARIGVGSVLEQKHSSIECTQQAEAWAWYSSGWRAAYVHTTHGQGVHRLAEGQAEKPWKGSSGRERPALGRGKASTHVRHGAW